MITWPGAERWPGFFVFIITGHGAEFNHLREIRLPPFTEVRQCGRRFSYEKMGETDGNET